MRKLFQALFNRVDQFLKGAVVFCLGFSAFMILLCYIGRWFGVDTSHELTITSTIFGGNLVLTLIIELIKLKNKKDKSADAKPVERKDDTL
ncbi:MAG: hypothetical protein JW811_00770 [Clostridiales bacterium]|nr:hypothetical protein [Clostridiales bacterium]